MAGFELITIASDDYPDPPGHLDASTIAKRFAAILATGGDVTNPSLPLIARAKADIEGALSGWSKAAEPRSSIVYMVGHGEGDGATHRFLVPDSAGGTVEIETKELAKYFKAEWLVRQSSPDAWALFILDCCQSDLGIGNLAHELEELQFQRPRRLGLWPVNVEGAATLGTFVDAFERAIERGFTENDDSVRLDEVFRLARAELGDVEKRYDLPDGATLSNPKSGSAPLMLTMDSYGELRSLIANRDAEFRNHFLRKARGAESGEMAWYFVGRDAEIAVLTTWLDGITPGMKVVTGDAGSGKSALLGHIAVLADHELVDVYLDSGLAPHLADGPRPPNDAFDAVMHLTGKTLHDVITTMFASIDPEFNRKGALWPTSLPTVESRDPVDAVVGAPIKGVVAHLDASSVLHGLDTNWPLGVAARPFTVLIDALDEAQEPEAIAAFLAEVASRKHNARVLVGTRRSTYEGPDSLPDPMRRGLLDALRVGDEDLLVLEPDPSAAQEYVYRRLIAAGFGKDDSRAAAVLIGAANQHFLFARLATSELKAAHAPSMPSESELAALLEGGHRGIFASAVERLRVGDGQVAAVLESLSYARGRGVPRDRGVWLLLAQAVGGQSGIEVNEADIDRALQSAAAYITLDAEAGSSTYRLAHQTFVEFFHHEPGLRAAHGDIARVLIEQNAIGEPAWASANFYETKYVVEHLTVAAEFGQWIGGAEGLVLSPGWLRRASELVPIDSLVELLATAHRRIAASSSGWSEADLGTLDIVVRALRRSRVALVGRAKRLGPMLHARLYTEADPALAQLGRNIAALGNGPWLEMVAGRLEWQSDLNTMYEAKGKVRALSFGVVEGAPTIAIGVDQRIELWDPRTAGPDRTIEVGIRPTALAFTEIDGSVVIAAAMGYDHVARFYRMDGTQAIPEIALRGGASTTLITVGMVDGSLALVECAPYSGEVFLGYLADASPIELSPKFGDRRVNGVSTADGRIVAHCVRPVDDNYGVVQIVTVPSHDVLFSKPITRFMVDKLTKIAMTSDRDRLLVLGAVADHTLVWDPTSDELLDWSSPLLDHPRGRIRAVALGDIEGTIVVVSAADDDKKPVIQVSEFSDVVRPADQRQPEVGGLLAPGRARSSQQQHPSMPTTESFEALSYDRLHEWPRTSYREAIVDGRHYAVTGSINGSALVWDLSGDKAVVAAGPFVDIDQIWLDHPTMFNTKAGPAATSDAVLGNIPGHGPCVVATSDGVVTMFTLEGERVDLPTADIDTTTGVALGWLGAYSVLVAATQGGRIVVIDLAEMSVLTDFQLDEPAARVALDERAGLLDAETNTNKEFVFRLVSSSTHD